MADGDNNADAIKSSAANCQKAIKLLTQYERLAPKYGPRLLPKRLEQLNSKRNAGTITSYDIPATMREIFPGEFEGMTLTAIRRACK
jgi:hypothetical protein